MALLDFIKNTEETSERHRNRDFLTCYYRSSYTKVKEAVIRFAEKNKIDVRDINDEHGEIYLQTRAFHIMVSVVQVNALETAVDLKVQTYGFIGFNKPAKLIKSCYKELNDTLTLKGKALHP